MCGDIFAQSLFHGSATGKCMAEQISSGTKCFGTMTTALSVKQIKERVLKLLEGEP